jgi:hypothetical protein
MIDGHGQPDGTGGRFCQVHGYHGWLYPCPQYPENVLQEIEEKSEQLRRNLNDPDWIREQIENDIPAEAVIILRVFAGLEEPPDEDQSKGRQDG